MAWVSWDGEKDPLGDREYSALYLAYLGKYQTRYHHPHGGK